MFAILKHKRNRKFDFFSVRSSFISLMNTKSGILLVAPPYIPNINSQRNLSELIVLFWFMMNHNILLNPNTYHKCTRCVSLICLMGHSCNICDTIFDISHMNHVVEAF